MAAKPSPKVACIQIPLKISTAFFERGSMDNRLWEKMANRMNGFKSYQNAIRWIMLTLTFPIVVDYVSKSTEAFE